MRGGLPHRLAAEALGTAFLLATVVGSGIMAERLAGGNDALALLGNTLPTGAILAVLIVMLGPLSGAHFNPAVSLAFALRGELPPRDCAAYVLVQAAAAMLGVAAAHAMFELPVFALSATPRAGASQWFSELVATFGLVGTILATLASRPAAVPYTVGLYIGAAYWFTASTSFANPAVTIARTLTDTFSGIDPRHAAPFVAVQIAGSALAVLFFGWLFGSAGERAPRSPASRQAARE